MKSDIETAIQWSKTLEALLESDFGATGQGLHKKIDSVQKYLPHSTLRKLRFIATIRNKIVHEATYSKIEDRSRFERTCSDVIAELETAGGAFHRERAQSISARSAHGAAPSRVAHATQSNGWLKSPSAWLSTIGGVAGFTIPIIYGEGLTPTLFGVVVGVVGGLYWRSVLVSVILALVIVSVFWMLASAHHLIH